MSLCAGLCMHCRPETKLGPILCEWCSRCHRASLALSQAGGSQYCRRAGNCLNVIFWMPNPHDCRYRIFAAPWVIPWHRPIRTTFQTRYCHSWSQSKKSLECIRTWGLVKKLCVCHTNDSRILWVKCDTINDVLQVLVIVPSFQMCKFTLVL